MKGEGWSLEWTTILVLTLHPEIIDPVSPCMEKAMAPHSSTLPWKIPWTEEPGELQSMGSLRVRHDWATSISLFTFMHWRRKWQPTPVFLPGESQGWGAWWAAVYGVAQSRTRLKWLSSSIGSWKFNDVGSLIWGIIKFFSWTGPFKNTIKDNKNVFGCINWNIKKH